MTLDTTISDLYNQGIVSGSTFLYCVENDINTVEVLFAVCEEDIPADVVSDISYLKAELNIGISAEKIYGVEEGEQENKIGYIELYALFQELKYNYDTRTLNRLSYIESITGDKEEFIKYLLNVTFESVLKLPLAGRNTARQIVDLSQKLSAYLSCSLEYVTKLQDIDTNTPASILPKNIENINALLPIIRSYAEAYSVRARNGILQLITNCNDNVYQLFETLSSVQFNPKKLRNIGANSVPEILDFKDRVIALCTYCSSEDAAVRLEKMSKSQRYIDLGISASENIINLEEKIGYFPLLAAVNQYINNVPVRESRIMKEFLLIFRGGIERDLDDMANELSLTRERIRQLANKQIKTLEGIISSWKDLLANYHYPIFEKDAWITMCEKEGVAFTQNFVKWLISLIDDTVHLIGDPISAFKTYHGRIRPLYLIPKNIYDVFCVGDCINELKNLCNNKRYEDESINLQDFLCRFFRNEILFEKLNDIENFVRRIINAEMDCYISDMDIVFPSNAEKPVADIVEDIIRDKGDAMCLQDIYEAYIKLYPHRTSIEPKHIRAHIHTNKSIRPIGRSGKYTLAEWKEGYVRGGTIREFAYEYILDNPNHIVSLSNLCEYIAKFREDVEEDNIQANLLAESSGRYSLFLKDGVRYIGLSSVSHPPCYVQQLGDEMRRTTEQSYTLLEKFIVENKRFPFSSGPGDEPRLYRFWGVQTAYNKHGDLEGNEKLIYDRISILYADFQVSRSDYIWYKNYIEFKQNATSVSFLIAGKTINKWFYRNAESYKANQLSEWQIPLFKELLEIMAKIIHNA